MKMSIAGKAGELVSKAVGALRRKAGVLRARLFFLASPRRRAVVLAGISRHIRKLRQPCQEKAPAAAQRQQQHCYCRGSRRSRTLAPEDDDDDEGVAVAAGHGGLPHHLPVDPASCLLLLVQEGDDGDGGSDGGRCTADSDWTLALRSLFDDESDAHRGGDGCLAPAMDGLDDEEETSVIEVIRRHREGDGKEFRMEDEIDRAADMYITRVRRRMSKQLEELIVATTSAGSASH